MRSTAHRIRAGIVWTTMGASLPEAIDRVTGTRRVAKPAVVRNT